MRKAFKQLTTEACLKPLTLCRYFFKSPKPKRAETLISYLISSELKEQSYQPHYTQHVIFPQKHIFSSSFPLMPGREKYPAEVITSPTEGHSVQINLNNFFSLYTYVQIQCTYISKILYTGALCIYNLCSLI